MRSSITEVVKLMLSHDHEAYDRRVVLTAQLQVRARGETLKVLRGMCCLADWLVMHQEEFASPTTLMRYCTSPKQLYKALARLGYSWNENRRLWQLFKNLRKPRQPKGGLS